MPGAVLGGDWVVVESRKPPKDQLAQSVASSDASAGAEGEGDIAWWWLECAERALSMAPGQGPTTPGRAAPGGGLRHPRPGHPARPGHSAAPPLFGPSSSLVTPRRSYKSVLSGSACKA